MEPLHSLLRRQLKRAFGSAEPPPGSWAEFVAAVEAAYRASDQDRAMLERSLELSSQELLTANAQLRAVVEAIPDLLIRIDRHGEIISFKGAGTEEVALRPGDPDGGRTLETLFPGVEQEFAVALRRVQGQQAPVEFEFSVWRGTLEIHYEARLAPVRAGGAIVLVRDITARRRAELELRAGEERFRYVALATRDAIYDWNAALGSVWRNDTYRTLFVGGGPEHREDLGWWAGNIHPDDRERVTASLDAAWIARERTWTAEYRFRRVDGNYADVVDRGYLLYDPLGRPARMIGAMSDLTERKRLQEEVLQAQKMDAVGQLAGGVAHDFNNLLTVLLGHLSLLRLGAMNAAETRTALDECFHASQRAAELTRQLLTFSRRKPVELQSLELNGLVANMTRLLHRVVGEHITIETSFAPGRLHVRADAGMLEQLLMNLVVNSRDAMPGGGCIHLDTGEATFTAAQLDAHPQRRAGRFARLRVSDTGSGIAPELLPHIFEPFFTTKEAGKGTGLGLATVFGIVQQHSGWIEVNSQVGVGTTFALYLPLHAPSGSGATAAPLPEQLPHGNGADVLLAEDEEQVRLWMVTVLERFGYRVRAFTTGREALDCFLRERPPLQILVTDLVMPGGVGGRDLAAALRRELPDLRVLFISGYSQDEPRSLERDPHSIFLQKPIDVPALLKNVRALLDTP